jgi:uncharacterized repeat protein (TIGR02543 family)
MPVKFNGTSGTNITSATYNGTPLTQIIYNGVTVFLKLTVTFNANGGTTPSPTTKEVVNGLTYGALATTSRSGFTFNGWFTASSGGSQVLTTTTVTQTSNHTLFAQWTSAAPKFWNFFDETFSPNSYTFSVQTSYQPEPGGFGTPECPASFQAAESLPSADSYNVGTRARVTVFDRDSNFCGYYWFQVSQ